MAESYLRIAGLIICLRADPSVLEGLRRRCGEYATPPAAADLTVDARAVSGFTPAAPTVAAYPNADVERDADGYRFRRMDLEARLVPGERAVATCITAGSPLSLECVLRLCLSVLLPARGALMVHCAALAHSSGGYAFTGVSGSGKSTVLKFLADDPRVQSLGDEVTILRPVTDGVVVESTPFGGELDPVPPASALLKRLFFLNRSPGRLDTPTGRSVRLLRNCLSYSRDATLARLTVDHAHAVVTRSECREIVRPTPAELRAAIDLSDPISG
ncbi:MAG TPA: hypothetical protein VGQ83_42515 [Polyangia bacterium]|jgi:hypothetical protein